MYVQAGLLLRTSEQSPALAKDEPEDLDWVISGSFSSSAAAD
jgi:hypothetical protein